MSDPVIVFEPHALRQRGVLAYLAWFGLPVVLWSGEGKPPPARAAVVCVADVSPLANGKVDTRGVQAALILRRISAGLPIVAYSLLDSDRLAGLCPVLAARGITLVAPMRHLDEIVHALGAANATAVEARSHAG